ncbi:MAG: transglutaminase domain-containing protein [Candidatus Omnitrophota bacterium]|nr:MAG: transglutaminase domain-containing protein [Candidatus Omnitrophota bacterium]
MKKLIWVIIIVFIAGLIAVFNVDVNTRQGVNYKWHTIKIPLGLKILDFFDRHYNYKVLVKRIIKDSKNDTERALKIFEWTYKNIRRTPEDFPVIDDHVWHIIVRGYGVKDQYSDVFTTLCNYAGIEAFYTCIRSSSQKQKIALSFLKIEGKWSVFDPYRGIYFKNKDGDFASVEEIKSGAISMESLGGKPDIDYAVYFCNLPSVKNAGLNRANIQSPLNRLLYELKKVKK